MRLCTRKLFCFMAGIFGACAFASYAAGAHLGGFYQHMAPLFLGNALGLFSLAISPFTGSYLAKSSGYGMIIGVMLFCGDLLVRQYLGTKLFPYAAPLGGTVTILSWLLLGSLAFSLKSSNFDQRSL